MEDHHGLMLTLWCWAYDVGPRLLRFCCAGHHPSLLAAPGQPMPLSLGACNPAIGMLAARQWPVEQVTVPPGSRLYVFSDGAFDLVSVDGRRWGPDDVARLVADGPVAGVPEPALWRHPLCCTARSAGGRFLGSGDRVRLNAWAVPQVGPGIAVGPVIWRLRPAGLARRSRRHFSGCTRIRIG